MVTYQDPCRLGRYQGIYDQPRALIQAVPGVELAEMHKSGPDGLCCGSAGWVNCGQCAKGMQSTRLRQAQATGAARMITACPKCLIHLSCACKDRGEESGIELEDLMGLLARALADG
jgi:Fe-S oxidoreductase